jgi:cellulose synthase/poly-beta-1,6-N-acetylglucosamine synthase-like glycosyltransferase
MSEIIRSVLNAIMLFCVTFGLLHYASMLLWGMLSTKLLRSPRASMRSAPSDYTRKRTDLPGVTMILPGYNEEVTIVSAVGSARILDYPDLEVIVVNDGSKDRMVEVLVEAYNMEMMKGKPVPGPIHSALIRGVYRSPLDPRLILIDKAPAGAKADAINAGVNFASKPWVVVMDADELVGSDVLLRCMTQVTHEHGNVVAVGVSLLPTNECVVENLQVTEARVAKNAWVGFQTVEYLSAFVVSRPGMSKVKALPIVSGGFGIFRRDVLVNVGGFMHPSLGEDLDVVVKINKWHLEHGLEYRIIQVPEAVVWTEFPNNRMVLRRQRIRWHRGLREVLQQHRGTVANPRYKSFGMLGMVQMWAFEWISVLIEAFGYCLFVVMAIFGMLRFDTVFATWCVSQALGLFIAVSAVWTGTRYLDVYKGPRNTAMLVMWACVAQFGYRQMTVLWRVNSVVTKNKGWGAMPRVGVGTTAKPTTRKA